MNKRIITFICSLCLIFSGCTGSQITAPATSAPTVPIAVKEQIPSAAVGTTYDLSQLITPQEGITYQYTATYQNPASGEVKELNVRKNKITPKAEADITVTITATQGTNTSSTQVIVPVKISADIMDQLLAAQPSEGVTKAITKEQLQGENSTSSLKIDLNGSSQILNLADHALLPYYSAQVWHNAAVSFWVYNPMSQDIAFQLICENVKSPEAKAVAGQWTHIFFSLYDMGITEPVFDSPLYESENSLLITASYPGNEACTMYIDKLDVVHADVIEGLTTGYVKSPVPSGNFSDLLHSCKVYTEDSVAVLEKVTQGTYRFGSSQQIGYPVFYADFPKVTDISGFDYLKFDVFGENCYPYLSVSIRYLDEFGNVQQKGTFYDYYRSQWQTIYLNLNYLGVDLSKAVGISFAVHMDKNFVAGQYNNVSFRNVSLYTYPEDEPQMSPAILEDNDIISGPFYTTGTKPNVNGVCKVATDENGTSKSNSSLLFWTNNACGYPNVEAIFPFDVPQDWSGSNILSFDTHQAGGHYWLQFNILYLDENGRQQTAYWRYDTIMTNWQTNHASLDWFKTEDGTAIKPADLTQVVGFQIAANMAINVTSEVAHIYFDNFIFS